MPNAKPMLGYPSRMQCCLALHKQGKSYREITALTGMTAATISALINSGTRPGRKRRNDRKVLLSGGMLDLLAPHAAKRGITIDALCQLIVETAAEDNMIDAILDDGYGKEACP